MGPAPHLKGSVHLAGTRRQTELKELAGTELTAWKAAVVVDDPVFHVHRTTVETRPRVDQIDKIAPLLKDPVAKIGFDVPKRWHRQRAEVE